MTCFCYLRLWSRCLDWTFDLTLAAHHASIDLYMTRKIVISVTITAALLVGGWFLLNGQVTSPAGPTSALIAPTTPHDLLAAVQAMNSPLVLVNFWASWCEPCKAEFPSILSLRKKWAAKGLKVIFVSIDEPRDFQAAEDFLRGNKVDFQTYYKGALDLQFVTEIYPKWEGAVPTTLLFGPKMDIVEAWEGDATLKEFEERIMRHLRGT
jgi:thiol-disulfide isomerase/thioredoxin